MTVSAEILVNPSSCVVSEVQAANVKAYLRTPPPPRKSQQWEAVSSSCRSRSRAGSIGGSPASENRRSTRADVAAAQNLRPAASATTCAASNE